MRGEPDISTGFRRLTRISATTWLFLVVGAALTASIAQERKICLTGVAHAPSVYIDSSSSEVLVVTGDGQEVGASRDLLLCPGDEVRTGATGRVAIRFAEKRTVIRLDGNSRTRILSGGTGSPDVSLLSGILLFVSSVRRQFQVDTPYIVAGIEGTEALVAVRPSESLAITAVRTGVVRAYDHAIGPNYALAVPAGEAAFRSASVRFQKAPIGSLPAQFRSLVVVSDSAVDWAIYYPPILLQRDVHTRAVRDAIRLLSSGDYERAEARLRAGGGAEPSATAALRTIIAVSRNHLAEAARWSRLALERDPNFAPAYIAASYVRQASGDLSGALDSAREAARLAPHDAYVLARLAELEMTVADRQLALATAKRSLAIRPTPLALFVAGLAELSASRYEAAEALFRQAVALDDEAPLPRLGLGLLRIREGETSAGAWELERALTLDPRRAALRNWLGRAYFDEGLPHKASEQFGIAKKEDPEDPMSYLFSAIERFAANRPIDALHEIQDAKERGAARAVLRSERGLGEDAATRGAALGEIYNTLSFDQQAIVEGTEAVDADPSNPGAHRFLAEAYRTRQDYEIARTSELLRSQLLSPPSKTPVQPDLVETGLALLDTSGPSRVAFAEFAPLYDGDGLRFDATGFVGTQQTSSGEAAATLLHRGFSLSVGGYHYETDGFHENNDVNHDIVDAVATLSVSPALDLFGEYRHRETDAGDRRLPFDLDELSDTVRVNFDRDIYRLGFHAMPGPNQDILGLASYGTLDTGSSEEVFPFTSITDTSESIKEGQLQSISQFGPHTLQIGGSVSHVDGDEVSGILSPFGNFSQTTSVNALQANGYGYAILLIPSSVEWTLGLSVDYINDQHAYDRTRVFPKLGMRWAITDDFTIRAAYTGALKRRLVADQTLEPTAIAGFNQVFDTFNGTDSELYGLGADVRLTNSLWTGVEATHQDMDAPGSGGDTVHEDRVRGYVNATPAADFAVAFAPSWEHLTSDIVFVLKDLETKELPLTVSYFDESGLFGSAKGSYVIQDGTDAVKNFKDDFFILDAALGYRFPNQRGIAVLEVRNLLDEDFGFAERTLIQDFTAEPRFAPHTSVLFRVSMRL